MQKLKINSFLAKTLSVLLLFVGVFCFTAGDVRAEDGGSDDSEFEVTLQTPFKKLPDQECTEEVERRLTDKDGVAWLCAKGSQKWQQVISGDNGNEILSNYVALLYKWIAGFIGIVSVLMLVVGGIQISTAGASQEGLQSGKDRIYAALAGLVLLFLSSLLLYTINPNFFKQSDSTETTQSSK